MIARLDAFYLLLLDSHETARGRLLYWGLLLWIALCRLRFRAVSKAHLWYYRVRIGWVALRLGGDVLSTYRPAPALALAVLALWSALWLLAHR